MTILPVIIGMGGMNSAGRSSSFHSYKRMVCDVLTENELYNTWSDLANRMGLYSSGTFSQQDIDLIKKGTLVRKIEHFDPNNVTIHQKAKLVPSSHKPFLVLKKSKLPKSIPANWLVEELENNEIKITISGEIDILIPDQVQIPVSSAGSLPTGFNPAKLYNSHHHPRGLSLAIYGASDALNSLGIEWDLILKHIQPDEIAVYAGSALSQVDENSLGGLFSSPLLGNRINSKMLPLSLSQMPADFINSYVINSVGATGTSTGACATFLYNLRQAIIDIQSGKAKIAIAGSSEAPLVPEILEGFRTMGALATDEQLCALDNTNVVDNRRACRPFSTNAGFTIAEASQFVVLMNDELALELGATIYGSVADVFINADANKKSISKPGVGNYVTFAKATALANAILGKDDIQNTFVQAHGPGTPQNRISESHILNEVAKTFSIKHWPVTAIKSYVGHSMSAAAGDQLMASLGVWNNGWIPGIKTIDHIADDVHRSNLNILTEHHFVGDKGANMKAVLLNAKGFGGNNATGLILSPQQTLTILKNKYGSSIIEQYHKKNEIVKLNAEKIDLQTCQGNERITYKFGESVMDETSVSMTQTSITLSDFEQCIDLPINNPYSQHN